MSNTVVDILSDLLKIKHEKLIMDLLPSVCDSFQPYKDFMKHVGVNDREPYDITTYYKDFNVNNCVNLDLSLLYGDFIKACYESGDESVKKLLILFVFMSCLSNYNEKSLLKGVYESIMKSFKSKRKIELRRGNINTETTQSITINNINNVYLCFVLKKKISLVKRNNYNKEDEKDYEPLEKLALVHITSKVNADNVIKWVSIPPTLDVILNIETQMKRRDIYSFISWYYKNPQNKIYNFVYTNINENFKSSFNLLNSIMLSSCNESIDKVKEILDSSELNEEQKIDALKEQEFVKSYLTKLLELKNSKTGDELKEKLQFIRDDSNIRKKVNEIFYNNRNKQNDIKILSSVIESFLTSDKIINEIKESKDVLISIEKVLQDDTTSTLFLHILSSK